MAMAPNIHIWPGRTAKVARPFSSVRTELSVTLKSRARSKTSIVASLRGACR